MNYLYNGVELPELPQEARQKSYNLIWLSSNGYILESFDTLYQTSIDHWPYADTYHHRYGYGTGYEIVDGKWEPYHTYTDDYHSVYDYDQPIWSQTNLVGTYDGGNTYEIVYTGSDPIPVGSEPFTPDPVSMTLGWLVGRRIASQRGKYVEPEKPELWETWFEGTVEAEENTYDGISYYIADLDITLDIEFTGKIRLTIDGNSRNYNVVDIGAVNIGNPWLLDPWTGEDDGFDMGLHVDTNFAYVFPRTSGTHTIKIERVIEQKVVAYSYNGVELPKFPYSNAPYRFIAVTGDTAVLYQMSKPYGKKGTTMDTETIVTHSYDSCYLRINGVNVDNPTLSDDSNKSPGNVSPQSIIWADYDVPDYVNGGIYLAASEPVPVYG